MRQRMWRNHDGVNLESLGGWKGGRAVSGSLNDTAADILSFHQLQHKMRSLEAFPVEFYRSKQSEKSRSTPRPAKLPIPSFVHIASVSAKLRSSHPSRAPSHVFLYKRSSHLSSNLVRPSAYNPCCPRPFKSHRTGVSSCRTDRVNCRPKVDGGACSF